MRAYLKIMDDVNLRVGGFQWTYVRSKVIMVAIDERAV